MRLRDGKYSCAEREKNEEYIESDNYQFFVRISKILLQDLETIFYTRTQSTCCKPKISRRKCNQNFHTLLLNPGVKFLVITQ